MKSLIILALLFLTNLFSNELKFGVYTSDKPTEMYKKFKPITDYLELKLKKKITLKIYPTYESAIDGLVNGEYDFGRTGPASYIIAKEKNNDIKLLVQEINKGEKRFNGVFITKETSNIKSLLDLKDKNFAFGDDKSTIGRYLSQAEMIKSGITSKDLKSFKYLDRHDKVALAVVNGDFDAGVVKESTFKKYKDRGLISFYKFDNVTKPWFVRANLPEQDFNELKNAMINIKDKNVLKIFGGDGFVETTDDEYNFVREGMNLSKQF